VSTNEQRYSEEAVKNLKKKPARLLKGRLEKQLAKRRNVIQNFINTLLIK